MGFHNLLVGQDLHEPSRIRIINNTGVALNVGQLVDLEGPVTNGVTSITRLSRVQSDLGPDDLPAILRSVAYVDSFIPVGNEHTVVLFGRILNVPIPDPTQVRPRNGDTLIAGPDSIFQFTIVPGLFALKIGVVLRRTETNGVPTGETMDVLFSPF